MSTIPITLTNAVLYNVGMFQFLDGEKFRQLLVVLALYNSQEGKHMNREEKKKKKSFPRNFDGFK